MEIRLGRRRALLAIGSGTLFVLNELLLRGKNFFAMGKADILQGMQTIKGDVTINGTPATVGNILKPGDLIVTGPGSQAVFVSGGSAYLLRENSRLIVESGADGNPAAQNDTGSLDGAKHQAITLLRLMNGKMLSVFDFGRKSVQTPSAYIGIRGTGIYVEVDDEKSYVCTCYGKVTLSAKAAPNEVETVTTRHHEAPRYVYTNPINMNSTILAAAQRSNGKNRASTEGLAGQGDGRCIVPGPMINHTDAELILLEKFVGRVPPFYWDRSDGDKY